MHLDLPKGGSKQITQNPNKDPSVLVVFPMEKNKHITLKNPLSVYTIYIYTYTYTHTNICTTYDHKNEGFLKCWYPKTSKINPF